jgi:hypothetical protein
VYFAEIKSEGFYKDQQSDVNGELRTMTRRYLN